MKILSRFATAIAALTLTLAIPSLAGASGNDSTRNWLLDLSSADVSFSVRVLGIFAVQGEFQRVHGGLLLDDGCSAADIRFSIDTASVSTPDSTIEKLLRGPTLLNANSFPVISFASTHIVPAATGAGSITGQLGLNGITREVSFDLQRQGDWLSGDTREATRFQATTRISRTEFGITALPLAVSDNIDITVVIDAQPQHIRLADATVQQENTP